VFDQQAHLGRLASPLAPFKGDEAAVAQGVAAPPESV